jgi:beta-phosphoglucomutase-like phosphatase (HAD superfamily)
MLPLSIALKTNCIVIEDSTNGVKAAKAAGIYCVGYNSIHSQVAGFIRGGCYINHSMKDYEKLHLYKSDIRNN